MTSAASTAALLAEFDRRLKALERGPRLANASIHNQEVPIYDVDLTLRQTLGRQPDGTFTLVDSNGPPPPVPSVPLLEARPGTLVVTWDGTFAGGVPAPADWDHVEVHVSTVIGYIPSDATQVATFNTLKGGSVTLALDAVDQYVVFQAVSTSRTESAPTAEALGTPLPPTTGAGGVQTFMEDEPPVGLDAADDGALWYDTNDGNHPHRWNGTTLTWVSIRDASIATAAAAASTAQTQANSALTAAQAAQATADGSIRTFYQSAAPWADGSTQPPEVVGDLWFDTDDGQAYRWSGTAWVIIEDNSIAAALAAAQTAQTTADGKITSYYQATIPTVGELGDLWYDTDDQNKPYYCSSVAPLTWTSIRDGKIAEAQAAATDALAAATPDGLAPASSPTPTALGGAGAVFLAWNPVANRDPVKFRLYGSTVTGFTPDPSNLIITTDASSFTHRPTPVDYTATYYYRLVEFDADGAAAASPEVAADMVQINNPDISVNYAYAGTMSVGRLTTGSLAADVTLSAIIRTGLTGARVEIGPLGIVTYASDNTPQTVLPSGAGEVNTFKGMIEASGLTITGGASFRAGGAHEITREATLTLQSNVTGSQSSPSVVVDWQTTQFQNLFHGMGLVWKDSKWWTGVYNGSQSYLVSYDPATGFEVDAIVMSGGDGQPFVSGGGLAWSGSFWYTVSFSLFDGEWWVCKWSPTGVFQNRSLYRPIDGSSGSGWYSQQFNVGTMSIAYRASTNQLIVAEYDSVANKFEFETRDAGTCALVSTALSNSVGGFGGPVGGLVIGNFDYGSERIVIGGRNSANWVFTLGATYTYQQAESFPRAAGQITGIGWDGANFFTARFFDDNGESDSYIYKHTNITWTAAADFTWWAGFTWYDSNATGGLHESPISPFATWTMTKRARYTITAPGLPPGTGGTDDVNGVRFYIGKGAASPAAAGMFLQGASASSTIVMPTATFSGTTPGGTAPFPVGGTPAKITNSTGTLVVSGDGSIIAESFKQSGSLLVADLSDTGWVALTANAGFSFRGGFEGYVRRIGNMAFMRGQVVRTSTWNTGTLNPVDIPVGFRPLAQVDFVYMVSSGGSPSVGTAIQAYIDTSGNVNSFSSSNITGNMGLTTSWLVN